MPAILSCLNPSGFELPRVMGILNVTPDSFYSGGRSASTDDSIRCGVAMAEEGADVIDIGGESTRPGADPVSEDEECRRVIPVVEALARRNHVLLSIDTRKAKVAKLARDAGASILNDVTALNGDSAMLEVALNYPQVILMHMQGEPKTMQLRPRYRDVVAEIRAFFNDRIDAFVQAGGKHSQLLIDPGIGFGKDLHHNLEIIQKLEQFKTLGKPIVLGASRKSFIGRLLGGNGAPIDVEQRLEGSLAVACRAATAGVSMIRVHDVLATKRILTVFAAALPGASSASSKILEKKGARFRRHG